MKDQTNNGTIYFSPRHWWERLFRLIRDYRITHIDTVDVIGSRTETLFTLVIYGFGHKAFYVGKKRVAKW